MSSDTKTTVVVPKNPADISRWATSRRRRRMLEGQWADELKEQMAAMLNVSRLEAMGRPSTSLNLYLNIVGQVAIQYHEQPLVRLDPEMDDDQHTNLALMLDALADAQTWAMSQRHAMLTIGLREGARYVGWSKHRGMPTLTIVPTDTLVVHTDPDDSRRLLVVKHARWRVDPVDGASKQYWDVWSIQDPEAPFLKVIDGDGEDRTAEFIKDPEYVWLDSEGAPYLPWVLTHAEPTGKSWDPYTLSELVDAALDVATYWSMFSHVLKNASWAQRYGIGVQLAGGNASDDGKRTEVALDPSALAMFKNSGEAAGTIGVLEAPVDPEKFAKSVLDFQRVVTSVLGVHPADLEQRGGAESGYAISLKRSAQRRWAKQHETTFRDSDLELIGVMANVMNNFLDNMDLPTKGWSIQYQYTEDPITDLAERFDYDAKLVDAGLLSRVQWYMQLNPGANEDEALSALVEAAAIEQALTAEGLAMIVAAGGDDVTLETAREVGEMQILTNTITEEDDL